MKSFKIPASLIVAYSWKKLSVTDLNICFLPCICDSRPSVSSHLSLVFHHRHQARYCIAEPDPPRLNEAPLLLGKNDAQGDEGPEKDLSALITTLGI